MLLWLHQFFVGFFSLDLIVWPVVAMAVAALFASCLRWITGRRT